MAHWMPGAVHAHLPTNINHRCEHRTRQDGLILHTAASDGTGQNHKDYWSRDATARASCHFYVDKDGTITQLMPLEETAWTSAGGSWRTIGVETQGWPDEAWTPQQIRSLAAIVAWASEIEGWPLQLMKSTSRNERGIGWHDMPFGGEQWNPNSHYCPGAQRVAQIPEIIALAKNQSKEGFLMALTDKQQEQIYDTVLAMGKRVRQLKDYETLGGPDGDTNTVSRQILDKVTDSVGAGAGARSRNIQDLITGGGPKGNNPSLLREILAGQKQILDRLDKLEGGTRE